MEIKIRRSTLGRIPVILCYAFLFIYRFFGERYDFFQYRYMITFLIICYALLKYARSNNKQMYSVELNLTIRFMLPFLYILAWSSIQMFICGSDINLAFTQIYRVLLILGISFALFVIFGDDAKYMLFDAMIITYTVTVVTGIMSVGFDGLITYLLSPTEKTVKDSLARFFEVHDLTFALGLYLIYFILFIKNKKKIDYIRIIISSIYIYMGYKRVELLAIILVYFLFLYARKKQVRFKVEFAIIGLMIGVVGYIVISSTDILSSIALTFGINTEGRTDFYSIMSQVMSLSPTYLGRGLGFVSNYIKSISFGARGTVTTTRMHNDLLMMYIELGFFPFLIWIYYIIISQTKYFFRKYGNRCGLLYFVLILYLVVTYATDNTIYYFMTQSAFCTVLITECRNLKSIDREERMI